LGAKDITTMARVQLNVTFTDPEDWGKVMVSLGKANDTERIEPIGLCLNRETMRYEVDMDFDLDEWKADLDGKRSPGTKLSVTELVQHIKQNGGPEARKKREWQKQVGGHFDVSYRTIITKINKAKEAGWLRESENGELRVMPKFDEHTAKREDNTK
jgi:hypothetical protein